MRFCVLGHRGMLGHTLVEFLRSEGQDVLTIGTRFSDLAEGDFVDAIISTRPDWCINAIGSKPPADAATLMETNAALPAACCRMLPTNVGFIHASSDGVFRPDKDSRAVHEEPDATDAYGLSKAAGERAVIGANRVIIRSSIIGPDAGSPRNLLSWVLLTKDQEVNGFTNQAWNGITSLEWARVALQLALAGSYKNRIIVQPATVPPQSKYDLLLLFTRTWNLPIKVNPVAAPTAISRTLIPSFTVPPLHVQVQNLKQWSTQTQL